MLTHALWTLLFLASPTATAPERSLLSAVPEGAFALAHCRDLAGLHERAERNDWVKMLGSDEGEPLYVDVADEFLRTTHTKLDGLLDIARSVRGEGVLFAGDTSAGFVTDPPADRAALADAMRAWLPRKDDAPPKIVLLSGARVELAAWPDDLDGWKGRKGHFAAFADHPNVLGLYSGDTAEDVIAALSASLASLETNAESPLVAAYRAAGGGSGGGIELFVDFTPFVDVAEETLRAAASDIIPDPAHMLGLERGTWLHATADLFPGTRVDCRTRIHLPPDTLASRLADTFRPLPHTLPTELPTGVESLWALRWDIAEFYATARAAYLDAAGEDGLQVVDQGLAAAKGVSGVDPIEDFVNQLEGTFAFYLMKDIDQSGLFGEWRAMGFLAHVADGTAVFDAFDKLASGAPEALELVEVEGVDAYLFDEGPDFDGGIAFLPKAFVVAPARAVLEPALRAIQGADGASLADGSRMQAAIDENAGACFLSVVELSTFRGTLLGAAGIPPSPDSEKSNPPVPFDSQLVGSARRTPDGFELRVSTR